MWRLLKAVLLFMPLVLVSLAALSAHSQALIDFRNLPTLLPEPPDRRVRFPNGEGVVGTQFVAQLFYATDTPSRDINLNAVAAIEAGPSPFRPFGTSFPGCWVGGTRTLRGTDIAESKMYVVRAWDNSFGSYEAAWFGGGMVGQSAAFEYTDFGIQPPTALFMLNFVGFAIDVVPEPSTIPLIIVGGVGVLWLLRRHGWHL